MYKINIYIIKNLRTILKININIYTLNLTNHEPNHYISPKQPKTIF